LAVSNLMEDAATHGTARWELGLGIAVAGGPAGTKDLVTRLVNEPVDHADRDQLAAAAALFGQLDLGHYEDLQSILARRLLRDRPTEERRHP
jgi:hypothetical protein